MGIASPLVGCYLVVYSAVLVELSEAFVLRQLPTILPSFVSRSSGSRIGDDFPQTGVFASHGPLKDKTADHAIKTTIPTNFFLETEPYYDMTKIPMNTFNHKKPLMGTVLDVQPMVRDPETGNTDIGYVKIDLHGKMKYYEGQSIGVRPPGISPKNGKPNNVRLYSIASSRYGDDGDGRTVSLCVRRNVYRDPETGEPDESKDGVCSNLLCKSRVGENLELVGPTGQILLLPEKTPTSDIIMVATGTGIAPYRGFWRRLLMEASPAAKAFKGCAWLFHGVPDAAHLLFQEEYEPLAQRFGPEKFRVTKALSRSMVDSSGGRMYIQDQLSKHAKEIFERIENGAHIYFCGLKNMMPGIREALKAAAEKNAMDWDSTLSKWKKSRQWHVEVY